jgi:release factor glutamine methyltransferase
VVSDPNVGSPPTVRVLLGDAVERLRGAGVESPLLEGELLLSLAMGVSRAAVLARLDGVVDGDQRARYSGLLSARCRRVPLAYLRGSQEFYGLAFEVSAATLIPRPETELLVGYAVEGLRDRAGAVLVDVGTGSGCIAVAVAVYVPGVRIVATDLSAAALVVARRNAETHGVRRRVAIVRANALGVLRTASADMVVANPAYIPTAEVEGLQPEVRDHEPRLALDGGPDGLALHRAIIAGARRALRPEGMIGLEVALGQAGAVSGLLEQAGFTAVASRRDLAGIERAVTARM